MYARLFISSDSFIPFCGVFSGVEDRYHLNGLVFFVEGIVNHEWEILER